MNYNIAKEPVNRDMPFHQRVKIITQISTSAFVIMLNILRQQRNADTECRFPKGLITTIV